MCGIIAYIGNDVATHLLKGLEQLQNRGYDSAGILTLINSGKTCQYIKYASTDSETALKRIEKSIVPEEAYGIGIGHTRWATHGPKTDINAHPHLDSEHNFAVVHNGIIENYQEIKDFLESKQYKFLSQTDTEVVVLLIAYYYNETKNVEEAIKMAIQNLEGTYALCITSKICPNTIYCIRKGSPLLVGYNTNCVYVVSEISGFCNQVRKYVILENNDLCKLSFQPDKKIDIKYSNSYTEFKIQTGIHLQSPDPYPHWTLREIVLQSQSVVDCLCNGSRISRYDISEEKRNTEYTDNFYSRTIKLGGLEKIYDKLLDVKHLIILGCGTSYFAGLSVLPLFKMYGKFETVQVYDAAEFYEYMIPRSGSICAVFISQSGETKDLYDKIDLMKKHKIICLGIINVVDSYIAREMDAGIYLHIGREIGVASTKAFTAQVICLTLMMLWFVENINHKDPIISEFIDSLLSLPFDIQVAIEKNRNLCQAIAKQIFSQQHLFILAKDTNLSYAHEGSLKLKEIGYIHSEAYSTSALKHGPYALIENNTPVILLCPKDCHFGKYQSVKEEIVSRGGWIIGISDHILDSKFNQQIVIPKNKKFFGVLATVMMQLIAYELSVMKGVNPDMPRNLAKVVTVD